MTETASSIAPTSGGAPPAFSAAGWKFLDANATTPFSGFVWPLPCGGQPGEWVEAAGPIEICRNGIHACAIDDIAWWLSAQLWEIELDGEVIRDDRKIVARRGRLLRAVVEWPELGPGFTEWCAWRARDFAVEVLRGSGYFSAADELAAATEPAATRALIVGLDWRNDTAQGVAAEMAAASASLPNPVVAAHAAARAAGHAGSWASGKEADYTVAFAKERLTQSRWLAAALRLTHS